MLLFVEKLLSGRFFWFYEGLQTLFFVPKRVYTKIYFHADLADLADFFNN